MANLPFSDYNEVHVNTGPLSNTILNSAFNKLLENDTYLLDYLNSIYPQFTNGLTFDIINSIPTLLADFEYLKNHINLPDNAYHDVYSLTGLKHSTITNIDNQDVVQFFGGNIISDKIDHNVNSTLKTFSKYVPVNHDIMVIGGSNATSGNITYSFDISDINLNTIDSNKVEGLYVFARNFGKVQTDSNLPEQFSLSYTLSDGTTKIINSYNTINTDDDGGASNILFVPYDNKKQTSINFTLSNPGAITYLDKNGNTLNYFKVLGISLREIQDKVIGDFKTEYLKVNINPNSRSNGFIDNSTSLNTKFGSWYSGTIPSSNDRTTANIKNLQFLPLPVAKSITSTIIEGWFYNTEGDVINDTGVDLVTDGLLGYCNITIDWVKQEIKGVINYFVESSINNQFSEVIKGDLNSTVSNTKTEFSKLPYTSVIRTLTSSNSNYITALPIISDANNIIKTKNANYKITNYTSISYIDTVIEDEVSGTVILGCPNFINNNISTIDNADIYLPVNASFGTSYVITKGSITHDVSINWVNTYNKTIKIESISNADTASTLGTSIKLTRTNNKENTVDWQITNITGSWTNTIANYTRTLTINDFVDELILEGKTNCDISNALSIANGKNLSAAVIVGKYRLIYVSGTVTDNNIYYNTYNISNYDTITDYVVDGNSVVPVTKSRKITNNLDIVLSHPDIGNVSLQSVFLIDYDKLHITEESAAENLFKNRYYDFNITTPGNITLTFVNSSTITTYAVNGDVESTVTTNNCSNNDKSIIFNLNAIDDGDTSINKFISCSEVTALPPTTTTVAPELCTYSTINSFTLQTYIDPVKTPSAIINIPNLLPGKYRLVYKSGAYSTNGSRYNTTNKYYTHIDIRLDGTLDTKQFVTLTNDALNKWFTYDTYKTAAAAEFANKDTYISFDVFTTSTFVMQMYDTKYSDNIGSIAFELQYSSSCNNPGVWREVRDIQLKEGKFTTYLPPGTYRTRFIGGAYRDCNDDGDYGSTNWNPSSDSYNRAYLDTYNKNVPVYRDILKIYGYPNSSANEWTASTYAKDKSISFNIASSTDVALGYKHMGGSSNDCKFPVNSADNLSLLFKRNPQVTGSSILKTKWPYGLTTAPTFLIEKFDTVTTYFIKTNNTESPYGAVSRFVLPGNGNYLITYKDGVIKTTGGDTGNFNSSKNGKIKLLLSKASYKTTDDVQRYQTAAYYNTNISQYEDLGNDVFLFNKSTIDANLAIYNNEDSVKGVLAGNTYAHTYNDPLLVSESEIVVYVVFVNDTGNNTISSGGIFVDIVKL